MDKADIEWQVNMWDGNMNIFEIYDELRDGHTADEQEALLNHAYDTWHYNENINISYDMVSAINSLDISCIESLTSIVNLSLGNCNFSHLKDFTKLIKLKQLFYVIKILPILLMN